MSEGGGKNFLKGFGCAVLALGVAGAICVSLLMGRGFRATAAPSAGEAFLARTVRNISIPRGDRRQKNPLPDTSDVLEQGRISFTTRCAVCHGIDGSGKTPVGSNLYPRVPDLRSAATQDLSDGDLHYIIENGVQLTGMPANPHLESSSESWKLVRYLRSFRPLSAVDRAEQKTVAESAHYVGSQACRRCHAEIYDRWKKTPMANVVRDPREHPDAVLPDLSTNTVAKFTLSQVAFVYGSLWKQRYFTKIGDDYFPLSAQWNVGQRKWLPYLVPATGDWWASLFPPDNLQRPTGLLCDGCHSVGYDIHSKQVAEWNVGCERCHGPGSAHVEHASRGNIVNPDQLESAAANDVCIQCHSQGRPVTTPIEGKYYDWPVGYQLGQRLQDFWKLEDCTLGETAFYYFPDCTAHKNRMQGNDFVQSVMYRHGIRCSTCHDVHGTENYAQLREPANKICLECHGPSSPNGPREATLEEHTRHRAGSAGSQCVECHMPKIQTEGVPGALVHAHTFRFIGPAMTDKYKIPNACTSCHADRSTAWAEQAMAGWANDSGWQRERWSGSLAGGR